MTGQAELRRLRPRASRDGLAGKEVGATWETGKPIVAVPATAAVVVHPTTDARASRRLCWGASSLIRQRSKPQFEGIFSAADRSAEPGKTRGATMPPGVFPVWHVTERLSHEQNQHQRYVFDRAARAAQKQ